MSSDQEKTFDKKMICPSCGSLTDVNSVICYVCNETISFKSSNDPIKSVEEEGRLYRNLAKSRPKLIVLIGVWIICLPVFLISLAVAIQILLTGIGTGFGNFIIFWVMLLAAYVSFRFLYRITRNYFSLAPRESNEWD